jgi:hypothetical protein
MKKRETIEQVMARKLKENTPAAKKKFLEISKSVFD